MSPKWRNFVVELPSDEQESPEFSDGKTFKEVFGMEKLEGVLGTGRFSALKTLTLSSKVNVQVGPALGTMAAMGLGDVESASLAAAIRKGQFKNLCTLSLPGCDVTAILRALMEGRVSRLRSLSIMNYKFLDQASQSVLSQELAAIFQSGCFKSIRHLDLSNRVIHGFDGWNVFTRAIKLGFLPNLKSLRLGKSMLQRIDLTGLVPLFSINSFQNLTMDGCWINSEQACAMIDSILKTTQTGLPLKHLDLHDNFLGNRAVGALVNLANSRRLLQLQKLDLSMNREMAASALVSLVETIQKGHLPSLQALTWGRNPVSDSAAESIARAYFENDALTANVDMDWTHVSDLSLRTKVNEYRDRNVRLVALKEKFKEEDRLENDEGDEYQPEPNDEIQEPRDEPNEELLPLSCAKVFLCGYPEVGKTKLRKSLHRSHGFMNKLRWETHPNIFNEPRTRGIELSRVKEKKNKEENFTLVLWDLAAQEEFHVLHGSFLPDLGFAGGKATTFVLVFKATYRPEVKAELMYWLRFVASSSLKYAKRHVVIVLNRFHGKQCKENHQQLWMGLIKTFAAIFHDLLDIHLDPFIIDVRIAASVKPLKDHLFNQARTLLKDVVVPRVCFQLQEELKEWSQGEKNTHLPILSWQAFEGVLNSKHKGTAWSGTSLKSATLYLHEIGEIIYFDSMELIEPSLEHRSIVVPEPEWFCRHVVGELLLPKGMLEGESPVQVSADGSISINDFKAFFEHKLAQNTKSDDVISMLEQVGLCYRKGKYEIIVPALIHQDDYSSIDWEGKGFHGVMGRCLATEDHERSAIPLTLFRRLQVELAQDPNFGGRGDSEYRAGKSFSSFKVGELLVLVQFDVDHSNPADDRIDILAKSVMLRDPTNVKFGPLKCICEIMQKLEVLCVACCPGLRYDIKVIKPWSAAEKAPNMIERKLMSLREIKILVTEGRKYSGWQLNGNPVEFKSFLSDSELQDILGIKTVEVTHDQTVSLGVEEIGDPHFCLEVPEGVSSELDEVAEGLGISVKVEEVSQDRDVPLEVTTEQEYGERKRVMLLTENSLNNIEESEAENRSNALSLVTERGPLEYENNDHQGLAKMIVSAIKEQSRLVIKTVREDGHRTREHLEKGISELMLEVQAQQEFSIEEKKRSVPRFMFLSRKQDGVLITLKEALGQSTFQLHLLCEAHFENSCLHEVKGQEGITITKSKEWLRKVYPWLRWSLQVAVTVGKTVGNVYLPGIFNFIPDNLTLAEALDSVDSLILEDDEGVNQVEDGDRNNGTATQPINLKERSIAQEVLKYLMDTEGPQFAKRTRLRRVYLPERSVQPPIGSSKQDQPSVLWICFDCRRRYGNRAIDL